MKFHDLKTNDSLCPLVMSCSDHPKVMLESLSCAFYSGKGIGPFGIMSRLSDYQVCLVKGVVQVQVPYVACAHCQGSGAIRRLNCTVCLGKGRVPAAVVPTIICPDCQGTGDVDSALAMNCLTCRGRGRIAAQ